MKMTTRVAIAGIFLFGMAIYASAAESLQDFTCRTKIETDGKGSWFQADIPIAVRWQAKYFDLRDLRVFNADGQPLPFALTTSAAREVTHAEDARLVWSSPLAGDAVPETEREYIWHFPFSFMPQRVRVVMTEDNVLAPVVFYGRDVQPAAPKSAGSGEGFVEADSLARSSGLRLRDVFRNSGHMRHKRIDHSPSEIPWQTLASGVLSRLPASQGMQMENELDLPAIPINQLRLRIDRRGSGLGHGAPRIELALQNVELTFLPRGNAPYWLAVGNADAQAADLPLTTLIPGGIAQARQAGQLGQARILGSDAISNAPPLVSDASANPPPRQSGKIILWAVLGIGVLLLAAMAFSLLRSMKKESKTAGPESERNESHRQQV